MRETREQVMARARRKRRALAELRGISLSYIDAEPIRAHVARLVDCGWTLQGIIAASGCRGTMQGLRLICMTEQPTAHPKWRPVLQMPVTVAVPSVMPDHMHVPPLGAQRRIQALMALGYRHADLTHALGGTASWHIAFGRADAITARTWRAVDTAFQRLQATPGPSSRSRSRALKQGYAPPAAWDDIDNPNERPKGVLTTAQIGA